MAIAKITLMAFDNYTDSKLWDALVLPSQIDKETLVGNILLKGGEFEVMYPDAEFLYKAIQIWSKKWLPTFEKWIYAEAQEFNPIENYDRYEEFTDTTSNSSKGKDVTASATNENVSAFNSPTLQPDAQTLNNGESNTEMASDGKLTHSAHIHGNIGVTTAIAMLTEYMTFQQAWNLYEKITDVFLQEFVIPVC